MCVFLMVCFCWWGVEVPAACVTWADEGNDVRMPEAGLFLTGPLVEGARVIITDSSVVQHVQVMVLEVSSVTLCLVNSLTDKKFLPLIFISARSSWRGWKGGSWLADGVLIVGDLKDKKPKGHDMLSLTGWSHGCRAAGMLNEWTTHKDWVQ